MTPFAKLKSIFEYKKFLKKNTSVVDLELFLSNDSPNEFAEKVVKAQDCLFNGIST